MVEIDQRRLDRPRTPEESSAEWRRIGWLLAEEEAHNMERAMNERASRGMRLARVEEILREAGISMRLSESWVGESSRVRFVYQGEVLLDDEEATLDTDR